MGNYLRLWDTFFELESIQYRALYVSPEEPFEGTATNIYKKKVRTSEIWLRIADEFNEMLRWFPRFQVATTCFSCSPPDLNLLVANFIFCIHVK